MRAWTEDSAFDARITPLKDALWHELIPQVRTVERSKGDILDQTYHIDAALVLGNGSRLTVQEKFRRSDAMRYDNITVEYYQDYRTRERGEFFQLCSQLYLYGVVSQDESRVERLILIRVADWMLSMADMTEAEIRRKWQVCNDDRSRASFLAIPVKQIDPQCIVRIR